MADESGGGGNIWQKTAATIAGAALVATAISQATPQIKDAWKAIFPNASEKDAKDASGSADASNVAEANFSGSDAIVVSPVIASPDHVITVQPPPVAAGVIEPDIELKRDTARVESCGVDEALLKKYDDELFRQGFDAQMSVVHDTLPAIMSSRNAVFYYDDAAIKRAELTAKALGAVDNKSFITKRANGYTVTNKRHHFFVNLYGDDCGYLHN